MNGNGTLLMSTRSMDRTFAAPERDVDYVLDRRDALTELLRTLPAPHGEAVRLFYFSDVPAEGIARRLGVTSERAREILAEAEAKMREAAKVRFPGLCMNGNGR
jgi:DNA-directed RNA polymerase specialized sigma24 family protein